jgi:hypothetical protein
MDPLSIAGLGAGIIGGLGNLFGGGRSKRAMKQLLKNDPVYQVNEVAKERYGHAQTLLNARMPGAAAMERNIMSTQANQLSNINRLATDSSQALALAGGVQGGTNQAYEQLGIQEGQDYYNRLQNLEGAQQGMVAEGDKVFQDKVRRWENMAQAAGANVQNQANAWNSLSSLGFGIANLGMSGAFGRPGGGSTPSLSNTANRHIPYSNYKVPLAK